MRLRATEDCVCTIGLLFFLASAAGCSGAPDNVATVTGKVTLDGQPLPGALVEFIPDGAGSTSMGKTDEQGNYTLKYTREHEGALIGKHRVRISTYVQGDATSDPPIEAVPEKVPAEYNLKTNLSATVEDGANTIDFPLESKGEIIAPDAPGRADAQ
jgi:hypothetical protein